MAKVRFVVKGNQELVQLIIRVSISRTQDFQKASKIFIPKEYWNKNEKRLYTRKDKTSFRNDADFIRSINNCNNLLSEIENTVLDNLINPNCITPELIQDVILKFHGLPTNSEILKKEIQELKKNEEENRNNLLLYIKDYNQRRSTDNSIDQSTKQKYIYVQSIIEEYQEQIQDELKIQDCNKEFYNVFTNFLSTEKKLMESTIKRIRKNLNTILNDAQLNGFKISARPKFTSTNKEKSDIIYLNTEELITLKEFKINNKELEITRDWLIVGCYSGQRISDFMRFNKKKIRRYLDTEGKEYEIIEIIQRKTKKRVAIPIHPYIKEIVQKYNGFPPLFSQNESSNSTIFNTNLKKLIKYAEIDRMVYAKEFDNDEKRNFVKLIPLYKAISSHVCRRSFATNFYGNPKFPTPLIMSITGHRFENTFLEYIGKNDISNALQVARIFNN